MNLTQPLPRSLSRKRRTALGLVFASVVLGSTLTACGSEADNTTCGELKGKSTDGVIDLFRQAVEEDGDKEAKAALDQVESLPDEAKDTFAETLKAECDGKDDNTKLGDL